MEQAPIPRLSFSPIPLFPPFRLPLPVLAVFVPDGEENQQKRSEPDQIEGGTGIVENEHQANAFDSQKQKCHGKIAEQSLLGAAMIFPEENSNDSRGHHVGAGQEWIHHHKFIPIAGLEDFGAGRKPIGRNEEVEVARPVNGARNLFGFNSISA